jgi:hypothetical protein
MTDFHKDERPRPAWKAYKMKKSRVTGKLAPVFPFWAQKFFTFISASMVFIMVRTIFLLYKENVKYFNHMYVQLLITIVTVESYILYNAWVASYLRSYYPELAYWSSFTSAVISLITGFILSLGCRWLSVK